MAYRMTRKELYDLVWTEPMKNLAPQYYISDVSLSKICRRHSIPVPERGYWAKLKAGKKVHKKQLPLRGPGMSDEIIVHPGPMSAYRDLFDQEILNLAPTPPTFDRSLDEIMAEVRSTIRKVTITRTLNKPHRLIAKVLNEDEKRKQKTNDFPMSFILDKPLFESPFERRRLRLLDSIFKALDNYGMRSWLDGKYARDVGVYK